ncbi:FxSxx-COOH system tetratricopeptide repeat protein [Streptomyces pratensis]|uniref:FxSxx-COOH system tetratricopeptide repeat protein n=2 Tax=Streptomyces pratensis TaxID=1169025 RepID=UPI0019336975|nr:FxSxx-COOH system tetratricopeptide repeat protein [Streptomyces pratensis]
MAGSRRAVRIGSVVSGGSAVVTVLIAMVTNYVTANPPGWAENNPVVWSVFGALAVASIGLLLWERRLAVATEGGGRPPAALARIAAVGSHSMNPPAMSAPVRGRDAELERIGRLVRGPGGGMAVVHGAGGLGKTTVAARAAFEARRAGRAVLWIRWRDDPAQLAQDLTHAAHVLGMPENRLEEARTGRASLVDAVWEHLATVSGWLIVVDNVDTPALVGPGPEPIAAYRGWLRPHGSGVLLVTSRDAGRQTWGPDSVLVPLEPLADEAGAKVLMDAAPHAGPEAEAEALAVRLGGFPLALNAAGTYLAVPTSRHRTFAAYRRALDAEFDDLLGAEHPAAAGDPEIARQMVRHTWDLSLDQLHQDGYTLARPVLQLLGLLEPSPIPRTLITHTLVTEATGLPATAATVDAALAGLHQYGLVNTPQPAGGESPESSAGHVQLHPLVREVIAHTLAGPQPRETWLNAIDHHLAEAVATTTGMPGRAGWPTARLLAPHLLPHLDRATPQNFITARDTLDELAAALHAAGAASEQLLLRRHVLDAVILHLGPEHLDTLTSRNNLAIGLDSQGEWQQAADLHRQDLADRERLFGAEHHQTLASRNNLASSLSSLGEYQEAVGLHRRNLTETERAFGPEHPHTLTSRGNLASSLSGLGEYEQAADLHRRNLADRERILGPEHPQTLTTRNNLASSLSGLGEYEQAADLHRRNLADRERILGPEHPHTLASRNSLANCLSGLGEYEQAAHLDRRNLADRERILGPEHPHTLASRHSLANCLSGLGEYGQAADLHRRNLTDTERVLGPHHPHALASRNGLASSLSGLGEYEQAADLHRRNLADRERVLGPDHPDTLVSRNGLATAEAALVNASSRRRRLPWRR